MSRGIFDFLGNNPAYSSTPKQWFVHLMHSEAVWYELIVNSHEEFDMKKFFTEYYKEFKDTVEQEIDRRFIYFIGTREKVRFSTRKKPRYSMFGKKLNIYLEVGKNKTLRKVSTTLHDFETRKAVKRPVIVTEKYITFIESDGSKITFSVHDFLMTFHLELGISTKVYYIGYTKNPHKRPLDGAHRGLSETLYRNAGEDNDVFIFYNIFRVTSIGVNSDYRLHFQVANSFVDDVKVDEEGKIIEKLLILYFRAESQKSNYRANA